MPLIKLLKTSTFRLAVIYLALFAASAITLLAYVYWNTAGFLARQTDEAVEAEIGGLAEQYRQGGLLLVGRDVQERREIESLITNALIWAIGLTVALGLAGGLFMSRNMLARVDEINRSSLDIMGGDLSQRLPIAGTGDELDQLGQNLNAMLDQIEALMTGMRQVTDNVAHDLRSPLNRLRNRLEVTLMQDASMDDYRQALEKTIAEADSLLGTFNALLMIARAEAGSLRDAMSWVDLSATLQDAAELYEPVAEENDLELRVAVDAGLMIWGNRELLSQAVANLLDNAIKHGLPQDAANERVIEVSAKPDTVRAGRGVVLSVADRGPGIPPDERQHVLERFVRLEASRNTPGSGLGLSLVAAVARLHGGAIELADNEPGLRVTLSLPVSGR